LPKYDITVTSIVISQVAELFGDAALLELGIIASILSLLGYRSAYLFTLCPLSESVIAAIARFCFQEADWRRRWASSPLFNPLLAVCYAQIFSLSFLLFGFFTPIMGRNGGHLNPDYVIGSMSVLVTHYSCFSLPTWVATAPRREMRLLLRVLVGGILRYE